MSASGDLMTGGADQGPSEADLVALADAAPTVDVQRIETGEAIGRVAAELARSNRFELCSTLPGGPYPLSYLRGSWEDDLATMARGVRLMCLYQSDAVREPQVLQYLTEFATAGAQVRISARLTHRTLIVDRAVALVAVAENQLRAPFLLIREPALVRAFHYSFAHIWRSARSVGVGPEDSIASENVAETIAILQSGVTDEVAARQLGISVRTVRRRVATVMELLGASSRFEAGVKAAKAGWI